MISFEFHLEKWHEKTQEPLWFLGFPNRYLFRFALLVAEAGLDFAFVTNTSEIWFCVSPLLRCPIFSAAVKAALKI